MTGPASLFSPYTAGITAYSPAPINTPVKDLPPNPNQPPTGLRMGAGNMNGNSAQANYPGAPLPSPPGQPANDTFNSTSNYSAANNSASFRTDTTNPNRTRSQNGQTPDQNGQGTNGPNGPTNPNAAGQQLNQLG